MFKKFAKNNFGAEGIKIELYWGGFNEKILNKCSYFFQVPPYL